MSINWVMLTQDKEVVRLPHEHIRHVTGDGVSLEILAPKNSHVHPDWAIKIDNGIAYITTLRVIYVPKKSTASFQSFAAPILNFSDSHISSPWFGSWYWTASVIPVSQGGIPAGLPRVDIRLIFKEGGHNCFLTKFLETKERLSHIRDIERETGQTIGSAPDEQLPAYSPKTAAAVTIASSQVPAASAESPTGKEGKESTLSPNEPPPGYDEAQAQQVSMRLEDHIREEAEKE